MEEHAPYPLRHWTLSSKISPPLPFSVDNLQPFQPKDIFKRLGVRHFALSDADIRLRVRVVYGAYQERVMDE